MGAAFDLASVCGVGYGRMHGVILLALAAGQSESSQTLPGTDAVGSAATVGPTSHVRYGR